MVTFTKNDDVKYVNEGSSIIPLLLKQGWMAEGYEVPLDRDALLSKAEILGIKVHHKAKAETIAQAIAEAESAQE